MRPRHWTLAVSIAAALAAGLAAEPTVDAQDADAEAAQAAAEELQKAIARGKELWSSRELGRKTCQSCHEDPDKPQDNLASTEWSYPKYSRRAQRVVTLQQKINEMIKYKARGKELDATGADIAALAAYVESLRKK